MKLACLSSFGASIQIDYQCAKRDLIKANVSQLYITGKAVTAEGLRVSEGEQRTGGDVEQVGQRGQRERARGKENERRRER
jgi:hypothetical protein